MTILPQTTLRRIKKIPQVPNSIWEGDRRPISAMRPTLEPNPEGNGECILWVDGSEGFVRAMDVISTDMGMEAMVRTLLRAMEHPHSPARPARPQKIIVRSKEIQFFLRGVLQNLEIAIDYVPELPLIDELFRGFEQMNNARPPSVPEAYEPILRQTAYEIWQLAPWHVLADYDIVSLEINRWGVTKLYACVMGMLGREYGVILYRSLESLQQFRQAALAEKSLERLEKAFLSQDCWFLSYEMAGDDEEEEEEDFDLEDVPLSQIHPVFGSVHPYEGIRHYLDEEESGVINLALQAIVRFFAANRDELSQEPIELLEAVYELALPLSNTPEDTIAVKVATLPDLSAEFLEMMEIDDSEDDDDENQVSLREDLIPEDSFLSLGMIPWQTLEQIRQRSNIHHQSQKVNQKGEGLPIIMVQTSRPKAKEMIEKIQAAGGLQGICFNPGEDPWSDLSYDLGILQMGNGDLYLFGEFLNTDTNHLQARRNWENRCQKTQGCCGLIIAMGITGSARGNPQLQDMMGLFETKVLDSRSLDLGVLQLIPQIK
jgi:hypothetical protein